MNLQTTTIEDKIKNLSLSDKLNFNYNRRHYFLNILDHLYDKVTHEEKMDMMYYFTTIEKCLGLSRDHSFAVAKELLEKLKSFELKLPEVPYSGLMTSFYPMIAFYYYAQKDYDEAEKQLNKSFEHIKIVYDSGESSSLLDLAEQRLNVVRLLLDSGKLEDAIPHINSLLLYIYHGKVSDGFYGNVNEVFNMGESDKIALFKHFFDSIMVKVNQHIPITDPSSTDILKKLFAGINEPVENSPCKDFPVYTFAFEALVSYLNGDKDQFTGSLEQLMDDVQYLPEFLQIMLLSWYVSEEKQNDDLRQNVENYFKSHLKKYESFQKLGVKETYKANNNPLYFVKE